MGAIAWLSSELRRLSRLKSVNGALSRRLTIRCDPAPSAMRGISQDDRVSRRRVGPLFSANWSGETKAVPRPK